MDGNRLETSSVERLSGGTGGCEIEYIQIRDLLTPYNNETPKKLVILILLDAIEVRCLVYHKAPKTTLGVC